MAHTKESIERMLWSRKQNKEAKAEKAAAKAGITVRTIEELPVRHTPYNGKTWEDTIRAEAKGDDAEEFARFVVAAWRIYKHGN